MQTVQDQFNDFLQRCGIPLLEYPTKIDGDLYYLLVTIDVTSEGVQFDFDTMGFPTFFDGSAIEISEGCYLVPFDDCFTDLDHYLQQIDEVIRDRFIYANGIYNNEIDQ